MNLQSSVPKVHWITLNCFNALLDRLRDIHVRRYNVDDRLQQDADDGRLERDALSGSRHLHVRGLNNPILFRHIFVAILDYVVIQVRVSVLFWSAMGHNGSLLKLLSW